MSLKIIKTQLVLKSDQMFFQKYILIAQVHEFVYLPALLELTVVLCVKLLNHGQQIANPENPFIKMIKCFIVGNTYFIRIFLA
jgi:hypothetical protein